MSTLRQDKLPSGWHRHPNGGGAIQDGCCVDDKICVPQGAKIFGRVRVLGDVILFPSSVIFGIPTSWVD